MGKCLLGDNRPQICKDFPQRQSDIDNCGKTIGEESTCIASIGGAGCNQCGQCCRDNPFGNEPGKISNYMCFMDEKGTCIWYRD